ncbi:Serine/threonine-protein kinase SSN3 [Stylophora pistillata]|uniref:Serine/threonine-protein kinase SSN3 n=1 Tax=Stylophora pistillata TaxID=50429 RepID=A0A2B4SPQ2_STYPI|nr:Serine/threonine-protein kinase SSN3 [Stylophora pistillata]
MNSRVTSLSGFLATLNDYDCAGFDDPRIFSGTCKDIANGVQYLHHRNVAHRDLKPANVLVSNQHYCQLTKEEIGKVWIECPMFCKLADFGESRSNEMQTKSILNSQTLRVNRATPVYQTPEILVGKTRLSVATIEDMKKADVWAVECWNNDHRIPMFKKSRATRHQVYDAKSKARQQGNDDVDDLLKYAGDKEDLALHHSDYPEDLWVFGRSSKCSELDRFTGSHILSHPFSVDPTFSPGKFEVTPVVFKHLLLDSKRTGGNPIFLGPTMSHQNDQKTYGRRCKEEGWSDDRDNGKPQRCYTNCSESMNNLMKAAKNIFTKETGTTHLTKLQFIRHVFEAIHDHQVEEFQSAVAGVSDEYVLADHSKYLQVPAVLWFDWSPQTRNKYIGNIQRLPMEDISQQKDVPWPSDSMSEDRCEFKDLEVDVAGILSDHFGYSADNIHSTKARGNKLSQPLSQPPTIQPKA